MSDRIKGLTVTLKPGMRDDDAQRIIDAIEMIAGVVDVQAHVVDSAHHMAVASARIELREQIRDILWPPTP